VENRESLALYIHRIQDWNETPSGTGRKSFQKKEEKQIPKGKNRGDG
jgi:hypothetical protein